MKRFFAILATLFCLGLMLTDAEAARLGGGRSSGVQRNNVMQRQAAPPANEAAAPKPAPPAPATAGAAVPPPAPSGMSRWLGPLAGLALGAGLMSMFSGGGMGGGMGGLLMMLLLAGGAFFLFASFRKRNAGLQPMQYAGADPQASQPGWRDGPQAAGAGSMPMPFGGASSETASPVAAAGLNGNGMVVPEGFDKDAFLRQAKVNFMRLQAANDRKDLHDIRNFTTPEMYAEISLEAQERGTAPQETDVTDLNAELLDVTEGSEEHLASVRFFGKLHEAANSESEAFNEVWHLAKPVTGQTGWLLAGIQQYT